MFKNSRQAKAKIRRQHKTTKRHQAKHRRSHNAKFAAEGKKLNLAYTPGLDADNQSILERALTLPLPLVEAVATEQLRQQPAYATT